MASFEPRGADMPRQAPPADLQVRLAAPRDAAAIAEISAEREGLVASEIEPRVEGELRLPAFGDTLSVWVAESEGRVLGFGRARWDDQAVDSGPRAVPAAWYLMGVVVRPEARRRGIGGALLDARLAWLADRTQTVYSVTAEHNLASQALLESRGFRVTRTDVTHPRITFARGVGLLLRREAQQA